MYKQPPVWSTTTIVSTVILVDLHVLFLLSTVITTRIKHSLISFKFFVVALNFFFINIVPDGIRKRKSLWVSHWRCNYYSISTIRVNLTLESCRNISLDYWLELELYSLEHKLVFAVVTERHSCQCMFFSTSEGVRDLSNFTLIFLKRRHTSMRIFLKKWAKVMRDYTQKWVFFMSKSSQSYHQDYIYVTLEMKRRERKISDASDKGWSPY